MFLGGLWGVTQGLFLLFGFFAIVVFALGTIIICIMRKWRTLRLFYFDLLLYAGCFLLYNGYHFGFTKITYWPLFIDLVLLFLLLNTITKRGESGKYFWLNRFFNIVVLQVVFYLVYFLLPA